jgi:pimeloyl-ACP methyl ester carboxylesterase
LAAGPLTVRTEFTIQAGSVALAAESDGMGPTIVCLHAGVCDRRMWRPLAVQLRSNYQMIGYDRRGFGQTPPIDEARSDVQDLCAVLDQCAAGEPVILMGASRGGALAIDLALAHPERVTALVLLASAVSGEPETAYTPDAIQYWVDEIEAAERAGDRARQNEAEVHVWLDGPLMPKGRVGGALRELLYDMNRIALSHPPLTRQPPPAPAYPRLESMTRPTLVLWGDLDFPSCVALGQELATRLPRARSHVVEGTAHLPSLERPELCAELIRSFFAEALSRS